MACRHLIIEFLETGDVEYSFFRHHSNFMLHRYLIDWAADKVDIIGGECLEEHNFKKSVTLDGSLLLTWDIVKEAETKSGRGVHYIKRGYLRHPANEPTLWHYSEQFIIKPDFGIWLHSPFERINAIQQRSSALFKATQGETRSFRPRELTEYVFKKPGVLTVNWILEVLDEPRNYWR